MQETKPKRTVGVLGGSGLYAMDALSGVEELRVPTNFGAPSDAIVSGWLGDVRFLFLPRHGRDHEIAPHRINYRANVLALKQLGAEQLVSISAVGSLKESIHPGNVVLVDQFIDRTRQRPVTFFDEGMVAHVEFSEPTDRPLTEAIAHAAEGCSIPFRLGGTYVCIEGPQFSTRAESELFRSWGADVIGMTNLPEARLAREAELPYASVALVTDYDCWHQTAAPVSVEAVVAVLKRNVETAKRLLSAVGPHLPDPSTSKAATALKDAILTKPSGIPQQTRERLAPLVSKYLQEQEPCPRH